MFERLQPIGIAARDCAPQNGRAIGKLQMFEWCLIMST